MALGILLLLGVVVSVWPVQNQVALSNVRLEGVKLELYPAADPDAQWKFNASSVIYNPDTRESQVTLEGAGQRIFKGVTDLELSARELTIDGNDNLRTRAAEVYIPKGCWTVKLGSGATASDGVLIDQNTGFRATTAEVSGPKFVSKGGPLDAAFNMSDENARFNMQNPVDSIDPDSKQTCVNGKLVQQ